jgi:hypothetical protein
VTPDVLQQAPLRLLGKAMATSTLIFIESFLCLVAYVVGAWF